MELLVFGALKFEEEKPPARPSASHSTQRIHGRALLFYLRPRRGPLFLRLAGEKWTEEGSFVSRHSLKGGKPSE